jgi:dehydrogenase/reductase SDR family protein 7B
MMVGDTRLSGKTILVTGGGRGIGREIARYFGRMGCNVAICGRHREVLEKSAGEFQAEGIESLALVCDVTDPGQCANTAAAVTERFGSLDILVNNAGMTMRGMFADISLELFHTITEVNFNGSVNMTHAALPALIKSGGSVVFISSLAGLKGLPGVAPYCSSKMALTALGESLRMELSPRVHVGVLYVSFTENGPDKTMYNPKGELIPLKREKTASTQLDVARACHRLVRRRKRRVVMTAAGKAIRGLYRFLPDVSETIIARFSRGSSLYAYDRMEGDGGE